MSSVRSISIAAVLLAMLVLASMVVRQVTTDPSTEAIPDGERGTEILFAGHFYSFIADADRMLAELSLFDPDVFVFGGDAIWNNTEENELALSSAVATAEEYADLVLLAKGNHDVTAEVFDERDSYGVYPVDDTVLVVLDTTVQGVEGQSCGLDEEQLEMLRSAVRLPATNRIIFMHHALWDQDDTVSSLQPNFSNNCAGNYWEREVLPIIDGKVSLVVSGDGGVPAAFGIEERDGIKYVVSGSPIHERVRGGPKDGGPIMATFVRIRSTLGDLTVDRLTLSDGALVDEEELASVPTYSVLVEEDELREIYRTAPLYEFGTDWQLMIEPPETLELIQAPIEGTMLYNNVESNVELGVRGNVGNHWATYKKSWNIDFLDTEQRQIKLIKPSDRGYLNQMFVQMISDWIGVPTPEVALGRLIVNDHDFGIYLVYEDFDKVFLELNGYGSDTKPSKNVFRDHFRGEPVTYSLNRISVSGASSDRSDQQRIVSSNFAADSISTVFERDTFARWLGLQMFLGDRHQSEQDNFRFFLDRSTGRYVMVTWDASLAPVDPINIMSGRGLISTFYENPANAALTDGYVRSLVAAAPEFREAYLRLAEDSLPVFQNDAALEATQVSIERSILSILETFDANVAILKDF